MKSLLLILLSTMLLLTGCASFEERPVKEGMDTRVVSLQRTYQAQEQCERAGANAAPGWKVVACAKFNQIQCTIIMRPDATDETLGHEARHCFDGSWHR
jgi:hypothetical protein